MRLLKGAGSGSHNLSRAVYRPHPQFIQVTKWALTMVESEIFRPWSAAAVY